MSERPLPEDLPEEHVPFAQRFRDLNQPGVGDPMIAEHEASVVEWRWASDYMIDYILLPHVREQRPVPRWLKQEKAGAFRHGFDDQGRLRMIQDPFCNPKLPWVTVRSVTFDHTDDRIEIVEHFPRTEGKGSNIYITRLWWYFLEDGRLVREWQVPHRTTNSLMLNTFDFHWENERVVREDAVHSEYGVPVGEYDNENALMVPRHRNTLTREYRYDDKGLDEIETFYHSNLPNHRSRQLTYRRPRPGESIPKLSPAIIDKLVERVPAMLADQKIADPVFVVFLVYSSENPDVLPSLALGYDKDRQSMLASDDPNKMVHLRVLGDVIRFLPEPEVTDEELAGLAEKFDRLLEMKDSWSPRNKVLRETCKQLMTHDWSSVMPVTDDFYICPEDMDGDDDGRKHLKACVPEALYKDLISRDLA